MPRKFGRKKAKETPPATKFVTTNIKVNHWFVNQFARNIPHSTTACHYPIRNLVIPIVSATAEYNNGDNTDNNNNNGDMALLPRMRAHNLVVKSAMFLFKSRGGAGEDVTPHQWT